VCILCVLLLLLLRRRWAQTDRVLDLMDIDFLRQARLGQVSGAAIVVHFMQPTASSSERVCGVSAARRCVTMRAPAF
jgi:hypothetical protein